MNSSRVDGDTIKIEDLDIVDEIYLHKFLNKNKTQENWS